MKKHNADTAAALAGVSLPVVYKYVKEGVIPQRHCPRRRGHKPRLFFTDTDVKTIRQTRDANIAKRAEVALANRWSRPKGLPAQKRFVPLRELPVHLEEAQRQFPAIGPKDSVEFQVQDNFTICLLNHKGSIYAGTTKRNPSEDPEDNPERAGRIAVARAAQMARDNS